MYNYFSKKKRVLIVTAKVSIPISIVVHRNLTDESDVGLSEQDVVNSIVNDDELMDLIKSKGKCEILKMCDSGKIPEPDIDDYTYEVINKEDMY